MQNCAVESRSRISNASSAPRIAEAQEKAVVELEDLERRQLRNESARTEDAI